LRRLPLEIPITQANPKPPMQQTIIREDLVTLYLMHAEAACLIRRVVAIECDHKALQQFSAGLTT